MYLVINKCVTAVILSKFSRHYLRNRSTSDIGVLGYMGVLYRKEHSLEVWHIPPGTLCIAYIDRLIRHKMFAKDANEAAVAHFRTYFHRFYEGSQQYYVKPESASLG